MYVRAQLAVFCTAEKAAVVLAPRLIPISVSMCFRAMGNWVIRFLSSPRVMAVHKLIRMYPVLKKYIFVMTLFFANYISCWLTIFKCNTCIRTC